MLFDERAFLGGHAVHEGFPLSSPLEQLSSRKPSKEGSELGPTTITRAALLERGFYQFIKVVGQGGPLEGVLVVVAGAGRTSEGRANCDRILQPVLGLVLVIVAAGGGRGERRAKSDRVLKGKEGIVVGLQVLSNVGDDRIVEHCGIGMDKRMMVVANL